MCVCASEVPCLPRLNIPCCICTSTLAPPSLPHFPVLYSMYFPQDVLGVCVCCTFLLAIRVHSLRTASIVLAMFFAYDVFMVGAASGA